MKYLQRLNETLTAGVAALPEELRSRHAAFVAARQNADGGFAGRDGGSDVYYTGFALRSLSVLGELNAEVATEAFAFLRGMLSESASIVDFYSLLYSALLVQVAGGPDVLDDAPADWADRTAAMLDDFRTPDGGYAKASDAKFGSTYHTFLVGMTLELLGRPFPEPDAVVEFLTTRRREDGGYVEIGPMKRSGTNPTAAAVGTMQIIQGDAFDAQQLDGVADFLASLTSMEGGVCANTRIPVADLLSTFTASWTLAQLGALDRIDMDAAKKYAHAVEQGDGGFRGGVWDEGADVEYTFYGLGVLALDQPDRG